MRLAFFASHNGTNMQAVIDACKAGTINGEPVLVISNNAGSAALERARIEKLAAAHRSPKTHIDPDELDREHVSLLRQYRADLIILAGYMRKLGPRVLQEYRNRIINIHPALLPKFGGQGMYGRRVHEAVLLASESETGATVHIVTENYDEGPILAQRKIAVLPEDTPETLAQRVLEVEHQLLVDTVAAIANGSIAL